MTGPTTRSCAASCATSSSRAMQRVPELAGRDLTLTALSRRDHEPQLPRRRGRARPSAGSSAWPATTRTCSGISREVEHAATVAAAGVGVGPEVTAFIRPEGYLVTRFIEGSPVVGRGRPSAGDARGGSRDSLRRIHDGPAIPGLFVPLRIVEAYRALALARGVPIPPEYELAAGRRRAGSSSRCLADPIELRPCHNDLLNANFIDDGDADPDRRLGVRGDGRPVLRPRQLHDQPRADARRGRDAARGLRRRRSAPDRLARLTLMRIVSDFREAMWGVLQQGDQHARRRLRRLRRRALRPAARRRRRRRRFERALREAAGD